MILWIIKVSCCSKFEDQPFINQSTSSPAVLLARPRLLLVFTPPTSELYGEKTCEEEAKAGVYTYIDTDADNRPQGKERLFAVDVAPRQLIAGGWLWL